MIAASRGVPWTTLAGTYSGVGANAAIGLGAGANILLRASAFILQSNTASYVRPK